MSWEATAHVLKLADSTDAKEISPIQQLVLYVLAARHHRDMRCAFGQQRRMVRDSHLNVDTIVTAINDLEDAGFIRVYFGSIPRYKDAPRRADGSIDGRSLKGNLYCFVGLDPDDGPNVEDAQPRKRAGGRPPARELSSVTPNSILQTEFGQMDNCVRPNGQLSSAKTQTASGQNANCVRPVEIKSAQPVLTGTLTGDLTGNEPERARSRESSASPVGRVERDGRVGTSLEENAELAHRMQPIAQEFGDPAVAACISQAARLQRDNHLEWWDFDNAIKQARFDTRRRIEDRASAPLGTPMAYFFHQLRGAIAERTPAVSNGHANGHARASPGDQDERVQMFDDQPVPAGGQTRTRRSDAED